VSQLDELQLRHTTGDRQVDGILRGAIGVFETLFARRIAGYYLVGSYADGTAVPTSDLDVYYLYPPGAEEPRAEEIERIIRASRCCDLLSPIEIHVGPALSAGDRVVVKSGGVLLYGRDTRAQLPLPALEELIWWLLHRPPRRPSGTSHPGTVVFPLDYPDPQAEFLGYTAHNVRTRDGVLHEGTHDFVNAIMEPATLRLALEVGVIVPQKSRVVSLYREHIGDAWTELVAEVYEWCRNRWGYLIPEAPAARQRLRELCRRALAYENHALLARRRYALDRLRTGDVTQRLLAVRTLGIVLFPDAEVLATVQALAAQPDHRGAPGASGKGDRQQAFGAAVQLTLARLQALRA
jgi:hypothetical protein